MRKLYKAFLLVFLRSKNLSIPYFALLVLIPAYFVFGLYIYLFLLQSDKVFNVILWLTLPSIFIIAFFVYISYELTAKMHYNHMTEYFKTYTRGLWKTYAAILLCLLTVVAIPSLMFSAFALFIYFFSGVQYSPFLQHLIKLCVLYFGLSYVIGIMLGTAMAAKLKTKRLAVYSLTVIFMLLNTTFPEVPFKIPYLLFNSYKAERILYYIKDFVTVVPREIGNFYAIDPIYGFPMEPIRWILAVFWIVFPLILICTEIFRGKAKRAMITAGFLVVLVGVGLFSVRGSTLLMDNRLDSYANADPIYYLDKPEVYFENSPAGFRIEEYKMNLTISNELHAEVEVTLDNPYLDGYEFTLYRGYILKSVYSEDRKVPFTREGDYISLGSLDGASKLVFKYFGKSPKYYANSQAVALPGYFPYYPKPGRTPVWDKGRYGYVINISPYESIYTVDIRSNLEIFCNLPGGNNSFQGRSNGLSLFAGMYGKIAEDIYAEPMRDNLPKKEIINEAEGVLKDIFHRLKVPVPEEAILSDKKFFQVPRNFALNSNTEGIVVMSDHITSVHSYSRYQLAESVMNSIIKPKTAMAIAFSQDYLKYLFNRQNKSDPMYQNPVDILFLLEEIDEWKALEKQYADMNREKYINMNKDEREAIITDLRRKSNLETIINEKAARYLFYESSLKEENMRIFYDYFTSGNDKNYLDLIERILREELEQ